MPLQNRVLPTSEIVAIDARGTLTGNRGIIHGPDKQLSNKRWSHHAWICCVLDWQGRKRDVMSGRKWTELFFLDEATAFAGGHRPCGYCRREAYQAFKTAWHDAFGGRRGYKTNGSGSPCGTGRTPIAVSEDVLGGGEGFADWRDVSTRGKNQSGNRGGGSVFFC